MISFLQDAQSSLGLMGTYQKFIPNLEVLTRPWNMLTSLSWQEFDQHMSLLDNKTAIQKVMEKIKVIIVADLYLALP
jgi:hypothetical protein